MSQNRLTSTKKIIQWILKKYLESNFEIEVKRNEIKELNIKPPYLIIGNHQNNWDGFMMSIYLDDPISFVISDQQFRIPLVRRLLKYIDAIPTVKARIDISTIKKIIKAKNENRIIGLFPEGNRTWDGKTQPIYYSTAKLIKLLNIPVVVTKFQGGHLASPRWATRSRKGKVIFSFDLLFSESQIQKATVDQINQQLNLALEHDEFEFQEKHQFKYRGKKLAERLENFLFACPKCETIDLMKSADHQFFCKECAYSVEYTESGSFIGRNGFSYFNNPRDWNEWQLKLLSTKLFSDKTEEMIHTNGNVILKQGEKYQKLRVVSKGNIGVDPTYLYFASNDQVEVQLKFPLDQLDGLNLQVKNQLDFYYDNQLYRFSFANSEASPYKWLKIIELLQQEFLSKKRKEKV